MSEFRICKKCSSSHPIEYFHMSGKYRLWTCKKCFHANTIFWRSQNRDKTPKYSRTSSLRHRYGISDKEYDLLVKKQKNKCLICKNEPIKDGAYQNRCLHIDHCHKTKKVRGLLCHLCNRGIGLFRERIDLVKEALKYLKKHSDT